MNSISDPTHANLSPKRVLFIAPHPFLEWRGSPLRVNHNVRVLAELGYDVDLLVMPFGKTPDDLPAAVTVHRPKNLFRRTGLPIGPSVWKALYDILLAALALRLTRRYRYAVIHGVEEAGAIAAWLGRRRTVPTVYEKHSDPASYRKGLLRNAVMAGYARLEGYAITRSAAVIATGPGLADQVRTRFPGKPVHHIFDIPSSRAEADDTQAAALHKEYAPEPGHRLAAYAGSFAVYQGIDLLFDAIPETVKRFPEARFLIIGGSQTEIAERAKQMEAKNARDAVRFIGRVPPERLPHYLRAADVLLSPRSGGVNTPLKILDYLKAGRPVVAADSEANRLLLNEDVALTPPPDPARFADAIAELMRDDARRARMGQAARKLYEAHYSYPLFKNRLDQCYRGLRAGGGTGGWQKKAELNDRRES